MANLAFSNALIDFQATTNAEYSPIEARTNLKARLARHTFLPFLFSLEGQCL